MPGVATARRRPGPSTSSSGPTSTRLGRRHRRGAIVAVQRPFNWAEELGYIHSSPVKKIKKPRPAAGEIHDAGGLREILGRYAEGDIFRDLLVFAWHTGCRPRKPGTSSRGTSTGPQCVLFPKEEAKGKKAGESSGYPQGGRSGHPRLMAEGRPGKLFLNPGGACRGRSSPFLWPLPANLEADRFKRMFCYAVPATNFATRKLVAGHGHMGIAALMGHSDGSMLAKVYAHLDQHDEHLRKASVNLKVLERAPWLRFWRWLGLPADALPASVTQGTPPGPPPARGWPRACRYAPRRTQASRPEFTQP